MNLAVKTTANATWKRLKSQYVAAALGLTLAVSASVAVGGWQSSSIPTREALDLPRTQIPLAEMAQPPMTYYIVDSKERADWVNYVTGVLDPSAAAPILVAGTPEEQQAYLTFFATTAGPGAHFIDLRGRQILERGEQPGNTMMASCRVPWREY